MRQEKQDPGDGMIRQEVERLLRVAVAERIERARWDLGGRPEPYVRFLRWFEQNFPAPGVSIDALRRRTGLGDCEPLPGKSLRAYLEEHQVAAVERIPELGRIELGEERISTGRAAEAVGITTWKAWCGAYERVRGKVAGQGAPVVRRSARLRPRFDEATWHLACWGLLPAPAVRALRRRLRSRCGGGLEEAVPLVLFLPEPRAGRPAPRPDDSLLKRVVDAALRRAAEMPLARFERDAAEMPSGDLAGLIHKAAAKVFVRGLKVVDLCREAGISDKSVSTKIRYHLGDTLLQNVDRRRIETSLPLVADRRFKFEKIADMLGLSEETFREAFKKRTGALPSAVRDTAWATRLDPAYALWHRVESGDLDDAEARRVEGYLRGLQISLPAPQRAGQITPSATRVAVPATFEHSPPPALAVRHDVDVGGVQQVLRRYRKTLDQLAGDLATDPELSAPHWYARWIGARLGCADLGQAWGEWQPANHRLEDLLELPRDRQLGVVADDPGYQSDAFLWLLVDCVGTRLFHDAAESEHFADLAVAAAEARWAETPSPPNAALLALVLALKANALRRRNELARAAEIFEVILGVPATESSPERPALLPSIGVDPWIVGRVNSLYASLLYQKGKEHEAFRILGVASSRFKRAGDELERVRCVVHRCSGWFAKGRDPSQLLTHCIQVMKRYPFAADLRAATHLNRVVASIYLTDQLTGRHLATIKSLAAAVPRADSACIAAQRRTVDGLIAALEGQPEAAATVLEKAASWFEDRDLFADAAVGWLIYSWAALVLDESAAARAAKTAYVYMEHTGFKSQGIQEVALTIYKDARRGELSRELLRRGILLLVCPGMEARLASEAEPP